MKIMVVVVMELIDYFNVLVMKEINFVPWKKLK